MCRQPRRDPLRTLIVCAAAVYIACEWFVNAVEWLGVRLRLGPLAVGTVLAAFGTALPESAVTFVAVVFGTRRAARRKGHRRRCGRRDVFPDIICAVAGLAADRAAAW
jgi:cation:H+ antiporter